MFPRREGIAQCSRRRPSGSLVLSGDQYGLARGIAARAAMVRLGLEDRRPPRATSVAVALGTRSYVCRAKDGKGPPPDHPWSSDPLQVARPQQVRQRRATIQGRELARTGFDLYVRNWNAFWPMQRPETLQSVAQESGTPRHSPPRSQACNCPLDASARGSPEGCAGATRASYRRPDSGCLLPRSARTAGRCWCPSGSVAGRWELIIAPELHHK
jgi:hypothetical protein